MQTFTCLSTMSYAPIGTLMGVALAYNVGVVGLKHMWYTMEMVAKDYVQDIQLQVTVRYLILLSLLLAVEQLFVEA